MAKQHYPGDTVHMCIRLNEGGYLFELDPESVHQIMFVIGYFANKYDIQIHGYQVLRNHLHILFTDTHALRSKFYQEMNGYISRVLKRKHAIVGHIYEARGLFEQTLLDQETIEEKLVYVLSNASAAGIVRKSQDYEGAMLGVHQWNKTIKLKRPDGILTTVAPDEIEITPVPPPLRATKSDDDEIKYYKRKLHAESERIFRKRRREHGGKNVKPKDLYCGMEAARRIPATYRQDLEHPPEREKQRHRPYAAKNPEVLEWALERRKAFVRKYKIALEELRAGKTPVFPAGTVKYRLLGIQTEPFSEDDEFRQVYDNPAMAA